MMKNPRLIVRVKPDRLEKLKQRAALETKGNLSKHVRIALRSDDLRWPNPKEAQ